MIKIPFVDLKKRYQSEKEEIFACLDKVLSSGNLILSQEVFELETMVQKFTGSKHCISLNSGTDALMMALWSAGIGKGDEVIHPPISFVATTGAIVHIGATPIFCDVRPDQLIDPNKIEQKITDKTKAIVPVHWAGKLCDMKAILKIAQKYNLKVIEDSAQSMGSYLNAKHGGTFGFAGAISCHPLKNFNALGDAGLMLTDDDAAAEKVRLYRNHGLKARDQVVMFGINSRLDALHAEVLKYRLSRLKDVIKKRKENADLYRRLITTDQIYIPPEKNDDGYIDSYVMFIVQANKRDELKDYLTANGIESLIYYGTPLHLQEASRSLGYKLGDFPIAEEQCKKVLALPHNQEISSDKISYIAEKINQFYSLTK